MGKASTHHCTLLRGGCRTSDPRTAPMLCATADTRTGLAPPSLSVPVLRKPQRLCADAGIQCQRAAPPDGYAGMGGKSFVCSCMCTGAVMLGRRLHVLSCSCTIDALQHQSLSPCNKQRVNRAPRTYPLYCSIRREPLLGILVTSNVKETHLVLNSASSPGHHHYSEAAKDGGGLCTQLLQRWHSAHSMWSS